MLPEFYEATLKRELGRAEYLLLKILINLLQSIKNVSIEALATALPIPIFFESRRKRVQRFLSLNYINVEEIWLPIIRSWLDIYFPLNEVIYVVIDRTNWGCINLLMISVVWDKRSIPIYFELLDKLGSSNFGEQEAVFKKALPLFKNYKTVVLGDREFCSSYLANWLTEQGVYFCLRLKKDAFIEIQPEVWLQLKDSGLSPGVSFFYQGIKYTKSTGFISFNVAGKWKRKRFGVAPEEGWFILTNFDTLESTIKAYKQRFDVEEMFRDFKSGGYNLEDTNASGKRLISLILLISLAYTAATISGQKIKRMGIQKYVGRIKESLRTIRRHSSFYIGLYGQNWVNFMENSYDLVAELLTLNINKN
ncbi:IS4 family transposase [Nostoc sp. CENA67]|uniref:IS4 family transposase n=1 Tax=Amazonocrinis nigriterrae CENA67 TaxID=2794033 RepID=A0A8J7HRH6_9NOST|nr:IS4 family transposase [Amazonocrinis nigriterrae]MBH8562428.1 IS4 family transposase [Amazonocrinis nigriterrae CENA67]